MNIMIKITNPRTRLTKFIDAGGYSKEDYVKTFKAYLTAGYLVEIVNGCTA